MMRFKFSDILLFVLIFIFVNAFPVELLRLSEEWTIGIHAILRALLAGFYIYLLIRNRVNLFKFHNYKNLLYFLPFLLAVGSNFLALAFGGVTNIPSKSVGWLIAMIFYFIFGVFCEEFVFRFVIHGALVNTTPIKRILASAGIFALMHLLNVVNVRSVDALLTVAIQVVYTFGIGILLGFIYEYTYSLIPCLVFHFLFNLGNTVLWIYFGAACNTELQYYLVNIGVGLILGIYTLCIYLFVLSKQTKYFRQ